MITNFRSTCLPFILVSRFITLNSCTESNYSSLPEKSIYPEELLKHIVPDKSVEYWQLENVPGYKDDGPYDLVFSKGTANGIKVPEDPKGTINLRGFFSGCMPLYCAYRIRYLQSGAWEIAESEEQLKLFIGKIDNEYEAFLIAKINDFNIDRSSKGNGFIKTGGGYMLKVMKYESCPESKESFIMFITKDGELKHIESQGYYLKTKDCLISVNATKINSYI